MKIKTLLIALLAPISVFGATNAFDNVKVNQNLIVNTVKSIGVGGGVMRDSGNNLSLNFENRIGYDTTGLSSMDYNGRTLYGNDGTTLSVRWGTGQRNLYDSSGVASLNWNSRTLSGPWFATNLTVSGTSTFANLNVTSALTAGSYFGGALALNGGATLHHLHANYVAATGTDVLTLSCTNTSTGAGSRAIYLAFQDGKNNTIVGGVGGYRVNPGVDFTGGLRFWGNNGGSIATVNSGRLLGQWSPDGILNSYQGFTTSNLTVVTTTTIGAGATAFKSILTATASLDFPNILVASSADLTITVTGAADNDTVIIGAPTDENSSLMTRGIVTSANTVTVRAYNVGSLAVDQAAKTYRVRVIHE